MALPEQSDIKNKENEARQTIHMKCQALFSLKMKKKK